MRRSVRLLGTTRVLFIGNSYTYMNDLPAMFAGLAGTGGHRVETGMDAQGGATLADHAASSDTGRKLAASRWNVVVLQEQSQIPSVKRLREGQMYPAVRQLVQRIRDRGAEPLLFLTWGHRSGWPENGLPDYQSMQSAVERGYLTVAAEQRAAVAPVGRAWSEAHASSRNGGLWQDDGIHPTSKGTYLAACVFYTTVFGNSPIGLSYHADLADHDAAFLQDIASRDLERL